MADQKISELTAITGANTADDDVLVIVDTSTGETKKITRAELFKNTPALDVTGTATMDGLTVDGDVDINSIQPVIYMMESDTTDLNSRAVVAGGTYFIQSVTDNKATAKSRITVDNATGDISFYEDTGTTAKFFWDASAESLGIGTSSPASKTGSANISTLALNHSTWGGELEVRQGDVYKGGLNWEGYTSGLEGLGVSGASGIAFKTGGTTNGNGSEAMRIDSSGNVGIGTSFPIQPLHVGGSGNIYVSNGGTFYSGGDLFIRGGSGGKLRLGANGANDLMTLDTSGNLLVGKTSTAVGDGVILGSTGVSNFSKDSDRTLILNRGINDGSILEFRQNNSTVGSIGTISGRTVVGSGDTGLGFGGDIDSIYPATTATQFGRDAAIDLGDNGTRFKDLYLSGGVYVGGTVAANYLDDYEEGTWSFEVLIDGVGADSDSAGHTTPSYTKIGNTVFLRVLYRRSHGTDFAGTVTFSGTLPFTPAQGSVAACSSRALGLGGKLIKLKTGDTGIYVINDDDDQDYSDTNDTITTADARIIKVVEFVIAYKAA